MSIILLVLAMVAVAIVAGVAGTGLLAAWAVKRNATRKLRVVPGTPSGAPVNWVGAHTPEAELHRRLVAATGSVRRSAAIHPDLGPALDRVEREAVRLETELVAAAEMGPGPKERILARLAEAVSSLEAVSERLVVDRLVDPLTQSELARELEAYDEQLAALREAWAELDEIDPPPMPQPGAG